MKKRVAFLFSGIGGRWQETATTLISAEPAFKHGLEKWSARFESSGLGWSILNRIETATGNETEMAIVGPCISAVQLTLLELTLAKGLVPSVIVGHSVGEPVAAFASGLINESELISIVVARSVLEQHLPKTGGLMIAGISLNEARLLISSSERIEIAGENSPREVVLSGPREILSIFEKNLKSSGRFARSIGIDAACHSRDYDELGHYFDPKFEILKEAAPRIPFYSATTGGIAEDVRFADFWFQCFRKMVEFRETIESVILTGVDTVYDISVYPVLAHSIDACAEEMGKRVNVKSVVCFIDGQVRLTEKSEMHKNLPSVLEERVNWDNIEIVTQIVRTHLRPEQLVRLGQMQVETATFMDMGLSSLDITIIASELSAKLDCNIKAVDLFNYPSIQAVCAYLQSKKIKQHSKSDQLTGGADQTVKETISIVGMACRFPGADGLAKYWTLLTEGRSSIVEASDVRWPGPDTGSDVDNSYFKLASSKAGLIDGVDQFDPGFFGITPNEAVRMDPQQRLLLQVAWHAIEDSGLTWRELKGQNVGVYVGAMNTNDYVARKESTSQSEAWVSPYDSIGVANSALAGRLAYFLETTGPALTIDTACSSSLVALHQAITSIERREVDFAIVGGVNLILSPWMSVAYSNSNMLSPDGMCKTFDAEANGYVRGEGCGVLVVCSTRQADRRQLRSHALILGSAVNQNGRSASLTAPSGIAQQRVIARAQEKAGVDPSEIAYVEAHGTGTPLGDPIEIAALSDVMNGNGRQNKWYVGSVKTNFGHLEAAAGMAGLIKAALAVKHAVIPAHLNFKKVNPQISLNLEITEIPQITSDWPKEYQQRLAGVSSFGFTGSNAHVIISEAQPNRIGVDEFKKPPLKLVLPISAKSLGSLVRLTKSYQQKLSDVTVNAESFCRVAQIRRVHHEEQRICVSANTVPELSAKIDAQLNEFDKGRQKVSRWKRIAMIFSGQGAHYPEMGKQLYESFSVFREAYDRCAQICDLYGISLSGLMNDPNGLAFADTRYAQPAIFALQACMVLLLENWGIRADVVLGHSVGEYGAAFAAKAISLEAGMRLVCERSRLMGAMAPGAMLDVKLSVDEFMHFDSVAEIDIAAINAVDRIVLAGDASSVDKWEQYFVNAGVQCRRLDVSHAFHSRLMDGALDGMREVVRREIVGVTSIPMISTVTGEQVPLSHGSLNANYWSKNIRQTVLFDQAVQNLLAQKPDTVLEIGPNGVLLRIAKSFNAVHRASVLSGGGDEVQSLFSVLASAYSFGVDIDWQNLKELGVKENFIDLPHYPFEMGSYWIPFSRVASKSKSDFYSPKKARDQAFVKLDDDWRLLVNDHRLYGMPVVPGAVLVAILRQELKARYDNDTEIHDIQFEYPFAWPTKSEPTIELTFDRLQCSIVKTTEGMAQVCVNANISKGSAVAGRNRILAGAHGCNESDIYWTGEQLRKIWEGRGLHLGPSLMTVESVQMAGKKIWARIQEAETEELGQELRFARFLDGILQSAALFNISKENEEELWLPKLIGSIEVNSMLPSRVTAIGQLNRINDRECISSWELCDAAGAVLMTVQGVVLAKVRADTIVRSVWRDDLRLCTPTTTGLKRTPSKKPPSRFISFLGRTSAFKTKIQKSWTSSGRGELGRKSQKRAYVFICPESVSGLDRDISFEILSDLANSAKESASESGAKLFIVARDGDSAITEALRGFSRSLSIEEPSSWGGGMTLSQDVDLETVVDVLADMVEESTGNWIDITANGVAQRTLAPIPKITIAKRWQPLDKFYVISGGSGAIGLSFAYWMAELGVKKILLISRHKPNYDVLEKVGKLEAAGVTVHIQQCNVADLNELKEILGPFEGDIGGVIHCAGILLDGLLFQQGDRERETVFSPKVTGIVNLHRATETEKLNLFICSSSIACHFGAIGQTAYATANAFMEGFVKYRRGLGLPGQFVAWPAWIAQGMATRNENSGVKYWESRGFNAIDGCLAKTVFNQMLTGDFDDLIVDTRTQIPSGTFIKPPLENPLISPQRGTFEQELYKGLMEVCPHLDGADIAPHNSLRELGLDSFDLLELRNKLIECGYSLTNRDILDESMISDLCLRFDGAPGPEHILSERYGEEAILSVICDVAGAPLTREELANGTLTSLGFDSFQLIDLATQLNDLGFFVNSKLLVESNSIKELVQVLTSGLLSMETTESEKSNLQLKAVFKKWSDVEPLSSAFIQGGWQEEEYEVKSLVYQKSVATLRFSADKFKMPADGIFHLPLFYSFFWIEVLIKGFFDYGPLQHLAALPLIRRVKVDLPSRITTWNDMSVIVELVKLGNESKAEFVIEGDGRWTGEVWFDLQQVDLSANLSTEGQVIEIPRNISTSMLNEIIDRSKAIDLIYDEFKFEGQFVQAPVALTESMANVTLFNWARWGSQLALIYAYNSLNLGRKPNNEAYVASAELIINPEAKNSINSLDSKFEAEKEIIDNDVLYLSGKYSSGSGVEFKLKVTAPLFDYGVDPLMQPGASNVNKLATNHI